MEETNQTRRKLQTAASTRKKGGESETAHNRHYALVAGRSQVAHKCRYGRVSLAFEKRYVRIVCKSYSFPPAAPTSPKLDEAAQMPISSACPSLRCGR